ncbi:GHMP kinase [Acidimicrobium ferrooxidans DSM 10331]|uniref:4-diphosphocytidyl-2-C-methyl-D-erythritol kinase n=1 Tax=Acidimicrobium ferrooxidans (strain DSM 10331 / JCM 15462 / NBRC 103882 / ICP) TaxID=525909 RepID=C7M393_ACIFD|nr:GHMP kinase [Acidimicrobium ferrooxidans]ACU53487.1 GHMP kinase [Acidimicrobium ferrooxidans DSM 10331]
MRLVAPAKLTRTLRVLGRRADGLHEVEIEAVHLALADTVDLAPAPATTIDLVAGAPWVDLARVPTDATNLAWRALELIGETGTLAITKRIPVEGGLGGGSADAGAVLRAFGAPLATGRHLGADVALCQLAGHVDARGIGEQVMALDDLDAVVTLIVPPFGVATGSVYRAWDALGGPHDDDEVANDLEAAACAIEPRLGALIAAAERRTGRRPRLAGSGSTLAWWHSAGTLGLGDEFARGPAAHVTVGGDDVRATRLMLADLPVWLIETRTLPRALASPATEVSSETPSAGESA